MATTTPKLGLIKPDFVDVVDVSELNDNMDVLDDALAPTNVTSPVAGEKLVFDGTNWVNLEGYVFVETVYFTSSGTFTKATYPWLRAIRVKCVGGGGGGGGAQPTTAITTSGGSGGSSGGYAESFITDIAGLAASVTVTRGAGGAGGNGANGSNGGDSSFGALVLGENGNFGLLRSPIGGVRFFRGGTIPIPSVNVGDFTAQGSVGGFVIADVNGSGGGGPGGDSFFAGGGRATMSASAGPGFNGMLGSGGGGAWNSTSQASNQTGGAGGNGIVIVELYA
jgi:hypothetical protein